MKARTRRVELLMACLVGTAGALLWFAAAPAAAHGHYHAEPYEFTVGWMDEPAVLGAPNGLYLAIDLHGPANSSEPVTGVAGDLTATLMSRGQSAVKPLEPQFGTPGVYTFDVIPTRAGSYSVRVQGNLNGTAVDFTAVLETPEERSDLEFPAADPSPSDLQALLEAANQALDLAQANATALSARVAALEAGGGSAAASAASTAMLIGLVGLAAGGGGAALGAMALKRAKASK